MTTTEVMELRDQAGFRSPLKPLEPGERVLLSGREDFIEYLVHPDDAFQYFAHGFPVEGVNRQVRIVDVAPMMNALQIVVKNAPHGGRG